MTERFAKLSIGGKDISLPVCPSTLGATGINVASLLRKGYVALDPGFMSTAPCESAITYIDGKEGTLLYRGYPIEQLAESSDFLETCFLIWTGELPSREEKSNFIAAVSAECRLEDWMVDLVNALPRDAHPMGILSVLTSALSSIEQSRTATDRSQERRKVYIRLLALMPVLAALAHRRRENLPIFEPRTDLSYSENFHYMMFAESEGQAANPVLARAMDKFLLLHADHEQNASTSAVRMVGSTDASAYASVTSGINALWGPAHGGANEAVLKMLTEIGHPDRIDEYVEKAKDRKSRFRLMGFGHRVYKSYDPRARVMERACNEVLESLGVDNDAVLKLAKKLEKVAREDEYFIERNLYPNIDFYSGTLLKAFGLPPEMFTVLFVVGRTPGWLTHWNEMVSRRYKITRPQQLYIGETARDYVPIGDR